jgi:hypothetical protein
MLARMDASATISAPKSIEVRSIDDPMAKLRDGWTDKTISRRGRSRVANGTSLIAGVNGNSVWCRRMKEIMGDMASDLGGPDEVSANEKNLIRRAATLSVEAERLEKRFALSEAADPESIDIYGRITGHLRRTLEALGMKRRPRPVNGLSLGELMLNQDRLDMQEAAAKQAAAQARASQPPDQAHADPQP